MPADHVHFNGSVNLADAESVMREIAARVPSGLRRIPDGETGDRGNWIFFQLQKFLQLPWLVPDAAGRRRGRGVRAATGAPAGRGVDPAQVTWPDLGYADAYLESYRVFARLRADGMIPAGVRFQVEYPTPLASIGGYIVPDSSRCCCAPTSGPCSPTSTGCWPRSRPPRWPCSGMSRWSSASWKRPGRPAARRRSTRSSPPWPGAWTRCPPRSPPGCTCVTGITAISISCSPRRWPCRSGC